MIAKLLDSGVRRVDDEYCEVVDIILDLSNGPFVMLAACLDESKNGSIFCVSGILLGRKGLKALDREWKRELKLAGVRYFHAVDCAHGREEFEGKSNELRMNMHRRMCEIMSKHVLGSVTVASMPWRFPFKKHDWGFSEYTVCAFLCMNEMFALARRLDRGDEIAFNIEDGHARVGELRRLIKSKQKAWRNSMASYAFTGKDGYRAVQAADVFAYETCKRLAEKSKEPDNPTEKDMRKSLRAIVTGRDHRFISLDDEQRQAFAKLVSEV